MYLFLQVNPQLPVSPDDHISTNTFVRRNITVGIADAEIGRIINDSLVDQPESGVRKSILAIDLAGACQANQ
jgi:hypothetical protein